MNYFLRKILSKKVKIGEIIINLQELMHEISVLFLMGVDNNNYKSREKKKKKKAVLGPHHFLFVCFFFIFFSTKLI